MPYFWFCLLLFLNIYSLHNICFFRQWFLGFLSLALMNVLLSMCVCMFFFLSCLLLILCFLDLLTLQRNNAWWILDHHHHLHPQKNSNNNNEDDNKNTRKNSLLANNEFRYQEHGKRCQNRCTNVYRFRWIGHDRTIGFGGFIVGLMIINTCGAAKKWKENRNLKLFFFNGKTFRIVFMIELCEIL